MIRPIFAKSLLAASALAMCSCASNKDAITKVKYYKLDADKYVVSADPSVSFEQKHYLHGAVTSDELRDREGHYYTVFWTVADKATPVKVKLEYRQANTGATVHAQEVSPEKIGSSNITYFQVTGEEHVTKGRVTAWRVSVLRGKETVATAQSYLWN